MWQEWEKTHSNTDKKGTKICYCVHYPPVWEVFNFTHNYLYYIEEFRVPQMKKKKKSCQTISGSVTGFLRCLKVKMQLWFSPLKCVDKDSIRLLNSKHHLGVSRRTPSWESRASVYSISLSLSLHSRPVSSVYVMLVGYANKWVGGYRGHSWKLYFHFDKHSQSENGLGSRIL